MLWCAVSVFSIVDFKIVVSLVTPLILKLVFLENDFIFYLILPFDW